MINGKSNMKHEFVIDKLKESGYSDNEVNLIIDGLSANKVTTFRVNKLKSNKEEIKNILDDLGIEHSAVNGFSDAFILDNYCQSDGFDSKTGLRIEPFSFYKEGKIYVQSLSSMMPVYVLDAKDKENILDMCAAPGGKATMIQSISHNKVNLTAVELHKDRYEKLCHNAKLQGANMLLVNKNSLDIDDMFKFDKILLDAPCSGSGILNLSNERYRKYYTDELISKCVNTQKKLIKKAYKLLNKGGTLIYSTCSLLKVENEDIVDFAIKNGFSIDFCKLGFSINRLSTGSSIDENVYIKVFPDKIWEGFFVAKLIKV